MTEQELDKFFIDKAFRNVEVNAEGIRVYYHTAEEICYLIIVYSLVTTILTREQQENIKRQVRERFLQAGFARVNLLSLVMTGQPQTANKLFGENEKFWILDVSAGRVMLYEDQEGDFCGLRKSLEELLFGRREEGDTDKSGTDSSDGELKQYLSLCNIVIIAANILVFLFCEWKGSTEDTAFLLGHGALCADNVLEYHEYYRLITYMFLHGGIDHLFNNMLILLFIGSNLERTAGRLKYLLIYFGSGILAGVVSMSYNTSIDRYVVCVGASGAIFGVVGALAYIILLNRGKVENLTTRQIILFILLSLYGGFTSQGVDNAAHIGGLAAGFLLALLLYRRPAGKKQARRQKRGNIES